MRWDASAAGGFTSGEPWLPMGADVAARNVATLQADERSLLWLYRRLIQVRRAERALLEGQYVPLRSRNDVLLYKRRYENQELLVALNTAEQPRTFESASAGALLLSTYLDGEGTSLKGTVRLRGSEGMIIRL